MKNFFLLFLFSLPLCAQDSLRLHVIPPMIPLDWSTPRNLFITAFKNKWEDGSRPFGHVYVELKCEGRRLVTSTKATDFNPVSEFLAGRGLGILYHTYEGALEEGAQLEKELSLRQTEGRILFIDYQLSVPQCQRMVKYFQEYKSLRVARYYGLPHRPLYAEGGTDAAFGVSFLQVAGVLNEREREEWENHVNIPLAYSGPPISDDTVNFIKVLFGATQWAQENEPHRKLVFYDPQKMYAWILRERQATRLLCQDEKALGVCLDASILPVRAGSLWLQHLDPTYKR